MKRNEGSAPVASVQTSVFDRIFRLDRRVRYCGLIDVTGKLIAGRMRENVSSLEPESEDPHLFLHIALAVSMDKSWDKYFGRTKTIVILKERVSLYIFSLADSRAVIVATEPDLPMSKRLKLGEVVDTTEFDVSGKFQ
jgi:hypothetical protein